MALQRLHDERPVSEGDIHAYTDGSLAHDRIARVRRYLAARPGEWHRILFYRRLNAQLRHSFGEAEHDPEALSETRRPAPARRRRAAPGGVARPRAAALALACLLAGAALAWLAVSEPSAQVLNDAAVMALMETGNGPDAAASAQDSPGAPLADSLVPVPPASVPAPFDLAPAGLRLVASGTVELGLFARAGRWVYENGEGKPVVLLASRAWFAHAEPQWSARRVGNLRLLGWTGHGERWVLAGDAQTRGLMRAADLASQEQPAREAAAGNEAPPR
ncbi:anti-sigma factor family protein [Paraburkholderia silviterrae]|uniref:Transcriptional regulator n=1 Tax=Paraburkholderia silviterrae TaxID=2528715 RepID=A0A4R5M6C5_9BURK|nr:transcriptional regulator [Paraburkholderia silviterrae]TDG21679.1 transcriptional regulator [Paraburkholderia silviterrae]